MLTVSLLGPVTASRDGTILDVPAGKTLELLARLAVDAGRPVRTDLLLADLWPHGAGRNTLQSKVSQLRRAVGDRGLVAASGEAYTLVIDPGAVDATRATRLTNSAAAALRAAEPAHALQDARDGLALFRGELLASVGAWAIPHQARLAEVRLGLAETAMCARVDLGAGAEIVTELESLVAQYPLRERLWTALVTALYRAGRQGDALAAYARVRALLIDELGVEPGPALQNLEQQVLHHAPQLDTQRRPMTMPGNLPLVPADLVGRAADLAQTRAVVQDTRLLTIVGPAGVGKTRLALELARSMTVPGGVWLVRLDTVDDEQSLQRLIAETLHVPANADAVHERLDGAETVLCLDNCEHLVPAVAGLVTSLLAEVRTLRMLATSQLPLGVDGEVVYDLEPLSHQDSVALFAARAARSRRRFTLEDGTRDAVENVCRALDGLPLAIELAAARVRSLSVFDIERRLDDRFALLRDPGSHLPERRRALSAAIGWSYDLLFPDDQRGLWALSCFVGGASLAAIEHVMIALDVPITDLVDTITRLVDRSLVEVDAAADGTVRYRMLDSIRLYATQRLHDAGAEHVAARAHADWFVERATWCDAHVRGPEQHACVAFALAERANIDAALAWCRVHDPALAVRLAVDLGWTWVVLGDGTAGADRVRRTLDGDAPPRDRASGWLIASWLEASAGDVVRAQADLDQARTLIGALDDGRTAPESETMRADTARTEAFLAIQQGRAVHVRASATAALAVYRRNGLRWHTGGTLLLAAFGAIMLGSVAEASTELGEADAILADIDDTWARTHVQAMIGALAQAGGRLADAQRALEGAAADAAAMGFVGQAALHRASLARVRHRAGDPRAMQTYLDAVDAAIACGDGRLLAGTRLNLARLLQARGEPGRARALLEENDRWYTAAGGGDFALLNACVLAGMRDDEPTLHTTLDQARAAGDLAVQVFALDALARLRETSGDHSAAQTLLAEADGLARQVAHLIDDADRLDATVARGGDRSYRAQ